MVANLDIEHAFEVADDSMQGAIAWLHYSLSLQRTLNVDVLKVDLPQTAIQITHGWVRYCQPNNFIVTMRACFELYACRVVLLAIVAAFERVLSEFIRVVSGQEEVTCRSGKYKARLEWACQIANAQNYPDASTRARIPNDCADAEHSRRIRNCFMHGNGAINHQYKTESLSLPWVAKTVNGDWVRQGWILLRRDELLQLALSHVELLHVLHFEIQLKYWGESRPYSYAEKQKTLEWHRMLIGI